MASNQDEGNQASSDRDKDDSVKLNAPTEEEDELDTDQRRSPRRYSISLVIAKDKQMDRGSDTDQDVNMEGVSQGARRKTHTVRRESPSPS